MRSWEPQKPSTPRTALLTVIGSVNPARFACSASGSVASRLTATLTALGQAEGDDLIVEFQEDEQLRLSHPADWTFDDQVFRVPAQGASGVALVLLRPPEASQRTCALSPIGSAVMGTSMRKRTTATRTSRAPLLPGSCCSCRRSHLLSTCPPPSFSEAPGSPIWARHVTSVRRAIRSCRSTAAVVAWSTACSS